MKLKKFLALLATAFAFVTMAPYSGLNAQLAVGASISLAQLAASPSYIN